MRFGVIVLAILLLSGLPCFSDVVLTDSEAAELEAISREQIALSEKLVERSRMQRQELEKLNLTLIEVLRSLARSKASLESSELALSEASRYLKKLEQEREVLIVALAVGGGLIALLAAVNLTSK